MPLNSGGSDGKESAFNLGDPGWIPGLGRSPSGGNGNPVQNACLENPVDKGPWRAIVHGVTSVRHDLATKSPPPPPPFISYLVLVHDSDFIPCPSH